MRKRPGKKRLLKMLSVLYFGGTCCLYGICPEESCPDDIGGGGLCSIIAELRRLVRERKGGSWKGAGMSAKRGHTMPKTGEWKCVF